MKRPNKCTFYKYVTISGFATIECGVDWLLVLQYCFIFMMP